VNEPEGPPPTEEEMRAALQEELRRVRIEQVVTEAAVSVLNVAVLRSGLVPGSEGERDLDQVRVGIEAVRGLMPVVEQVAPEQARAIREALSQLQMAYVKASSGAAPSSGEDEPPAPAEQQPGEGEQGPGPAQQSGRLWVPGQ
jgi:hypothetical protein